jgi:AbrB family looped-hinge helix DNA binding protein
MPVRGVATQAKVQSRLSRIGQRHQVVIPKAVLDSLGLGEGDFVEVSTERKLIVMKPKRPVDATEVLTRGEASKVRRGEAELRRGRSRPWAAIRDELAG